MLRMAWRNLWRNGSRTLITASAIALVYAVYLISNGVQDWSFDEMRGAASKAAGGDVIVQGAGYLDNPENGLLLANGAELAAKIAAVSGVEAVAPRVIVAGLLSTSASSVPVSLRGIDPPAEAKVHDLRGYLAEGTWFDGSTDDPLVLGKAIATELDAQIGDRVILTATDGEGEMRRALFRLTGIISTGSPVADRGYAFTTVPAAQKALGIESGLSQIGVLGPERASLADRLRAAIADDAVEVLPWDVAMPELLGFIEMKKGGGAFMGVLLFFVVLFSIVNTFLMIVMERVREFGLLGALGLTPMQSAAVLLLETVMLALVAMAIGLTLALAAHTWIAVNGIDMAALYGNSMEVAGVQLTDSVIRSTIDPVRWTGASAAVLVMVVLSAVYPAFKAARLRPAEAMRFYE